MEALSNRLFGLEMQQPFAEMVIAGTKTVETRSYPLPSSLLYKHICLIESMPGKDGISDLKDFAYNRTCEEEGESHPRILGTIAFSECFEYESEEQWRQDSEVHRVPVDTYYDWPPSRKLEYMIKEERKEREKRHRREICAELIDQIIECSLMKREEMESLAFLEISSSIVDMNDGDDGSVNSTTSTTDHVDGALETILKKKKEGGLRSKLGSLRREKASKRIEMRSTVLDGIKPRTMSRSGEEFATTVDSAADIDTLTQTSEFIFDLESSEVDMDLDDMIAEVQARPVADKDKRYGWRVMGVCPNATIGSDKVQHFVRVYRSLFDCGSYAMVDYL